MYLNYLYLCYYLVSISALCFTLYASLYLLIKRPEKNVKVSRTPTVYLYFWFTASSSVLMLINAGYILMFWRHDEVIYNPTVLYYFAGIPTIYVNFVHVADFYLCLDRVLLVTFPFGYFRNNINYLVAIIFGANVSILLLAYFLATKYFAFYTSETKTSCVFYICLVFELNYPQIMAWVKYIFCALTVIAAGALILLNIFRKSVDKNLSKKLNKPVIMVAFINLGFAYVPGLLNSLVLVVWNIRSMEVIGDYNLTFLCINIAACVCLYWRVYRKHFFTVASVQQVNSFSQPTNLIQRTPRSVRK